MQMHNLTRAVHDKLQICFNDGRFNSNSSIKFVKEQTKMLGLSFSAIEKEIYGLDISVKDYFYFLQRHNLLWLYAIEASFYPVSYGKTSYNNIVELAKICNVSISELRKQYLLLGNIKSAVLSCENTFNSGKSIPIEVHGETYSSIFRACVELNVDYYKVKALRVGGASIEEAIEQLLYEQMQPAV
ncbi:hypothetical protein ABD91_20555 [Lysinibacillus sphaericus]|uniref:hypothetical protein n=1 Tax=Lysinibacillus sphaericus TaxID=1421 RepID=UPI0018CD517F|nr:hypothetical protein [Lysinibacillus sphaericus]MBG9693135.1 hypothetical protein [Lysinibacillus sphaericus]